MQRPKKHVMEDQSAGLLRRLIPDEWILRPVAKDYGVDFEVELVDQTVVTGNRIWVQLKSAQRIPTRPAKRGVAITDFISFGLSTKELHYALQCPFPLLLMVAVLEMGEIFWLPIRAAFFNSKKSRNPKWSEQVSHIVHIPCSNSFSNERTTDFGGLRFYALEPARMYAFALLIQMQADFKEEHRLDGYEIGEGCISDGAEREPRSSLLSAQQLLSDALQIEVVFGNCTGPFWLAAEGIKHGVAASDAAFSKLTSGDYDAQTLARLLGDANHAVQLLSTIIAMYPACRGRFLPNGLFLST